MRKVVDKLLKLDPAKIIWAEAESSILSELESHDRDCFFKTIDLFTKSSQGSEHFWQSMEPISLQYLQSHLNGIQLEGKEIELLIKGHLENNYQTKDPEFEKELINVSMDYADQVIDSDDENYREKLKDAQELYDQLMDSKPGNENLSIDRKKLKDFQELLTVAKFLDDETKEAMKQELELIEKYSK